MTEGTCAGEERGDRVVAFLWIVPDVAFLQACG